MISSLMNALVGEYFCEISRNVDKLFTVYFVYVRPLRIVVAFIRYFYTAFLLLLVYFFMPLFFYTDVVAIFLFIY